MAPSDSYAKPWDWRIALNHALFDVDGKPTFHAFDVNNNAACEPLFGLVATIEEPSEGSNLCRSCMEFVRDNMAGRSLRVWDEEALNDA